MSQPEHPEPPDGPRADLTKRSPEPGSALPPGYAPPPQVPGPPPGYGPPPQGLGPQGYGPQGFGPQGYGPQGYGPPPSAPLVGPYSPLVGRALTQDEKTWGLLAHLGGLLIGFLAPLVVLLVKGSESPYTRAQAASALNFQIALTIAYVVAIVSLIVLIGFVLLPLVALAHLVLGILASVAASNGQVYKYPLTPSLVS